MTETNIDVYNYCQWLDIQNCSINVTITKDKDIIQDSIEFVNNKQGKLYVYIFSYGPCNDEFMESFGEIFADYLTKNVNTHNYRIAENINAFEIIPQFEKLREEQKENNKSYMLKFEKPEKQDELRETETV
jgi:hypothetical protein